MLGNWLCKQIHKEGNNIPALNLSRRAAAATLNLSLNCLHCSAVPTTKWQAGMQQSTLCWKRSRSYTKRCSDAEPNSTTTNPYPYYYNSNHVLNPAGMAEGWVVEATAARFSRSAAALSKKIWRRFWWPPVSLYKTNSHNFITNKLPKRVAIPEYYASTTTIKYTSMLN